MTRVAGIQVNKTTKGEIKSLTIDVKKHAYDLKPFLEKLGIVEDDDFEKEWKQAITGDELMKRLKPRIKKLFQDDGRI